MVAALLTRLRRLGWETYGWLIYSLPYLFGAFDARLSAGERAAMLAAYPVFLAAYLLGQGVRGPRIFAAVAIVDLIAFAFMPHNPSASAFLIYGAALVGPAFAPRRAAGVLAIQVVVGIAGSALIGMPAWFYGMTAVIAALIGAVTMQAAAREAGDAKLRLAQAEVERLAKLAERERIARDLHDVLGHTLSVVVLKSELARKLLPSDPARASKEIAEVETVARAGLSEVRAAITGYRTSDLPGEIARVRDALAAAGIEATVEAGEVPLAPAQEGALTLALREAATNVIRHAGATRCLIRFQARDASVLLEVEDNGRGGDAPYGNGLNGMRERIQALGGALRRETGGGTRLLITLPRASA